MDRYEALRQIENLWNDSSLSLGDKILGISTAYYEVGLDLETTAAFIRVTPAELDALLSLSSLDNDIIDEISKVNPPKTTWMLLASASEEEVRQAITALSKSKERNDEGQGVAVSEFVYQQMIEVSGPTPEKLLTMLTGNELEFIFRRGKEFKALTEWESKFLKNLANQKKTGKVFSSKQIGKLKDILIGLAERDVLVRNSIDDDKAVCEKVLDIIGK